MLTVPSPPVVTSGLLVSSGRRSLMLGKLHVSVVGLPTAAAGAQQQQQQQRSGNPHLQIV
jgi:hypothetical protein